MARPPSSLAALRRVLAQATRPVAVLNADRELVFANPALAAWCGVPLEELVGQRCLDRMVGPEASRGSQAAAGLCPPEDQLMASASPQAPPAASTGRYLAVAPGGDAKHRWVDLIAWEARPETPGAASPEPPAWALEAVILVLGGRDLTEQELLEASQPEPGGEPAWRAQLRRLRRDLGEFATYELLGDSALMRRVREQVEAATVCRASVLIWGPRGVGREAVARSIHYASQAGANGSLTPLACALLDPELLRSALEDLRRYGGDEEKAGGATLALLDVDRLEAASQAPLRDAVDALAARGVRLLATSRAPLGDLAAAGEFDEGLACRLSAVSIHLPPLSQRREDLGVLARLAVEDHNARGGIQLSGWDSEAMDFLQLYPWPENVGELRRLLDRACRQALPPRVRAGDLPEAIRQSLRAAAHPPRRDEPVALDEFLSRVERELLQRALELSQGNRADAARRLGISRARLLRRLEQFGLS